MNRDLLLSILAMDSYNRGYGAAILGLDENGKLGNATLIAATKEQQVGWQSSGFYAIAYDVSSVGVDGLTGTVISYRGTNYDDTAGYSKFRDIWNGWIVGAGVPTGQANLALDLYKAVNDGISAFDLTGGKAITLTGHSLGGGLAGFVGTLHGDAALGFDYMPFLAATYAEWIVEYVKRLEASGRSIATVPTAALLTELNLRSPSYAAFNGISLEGEINWILRNGAAAATLGVILAGATALVPLVGPILSGLSAIAGGAIAGGQIAETALLGNQVRTLSTYDWSMPYDPLSGAARHSMGTLVIAKFAEDQEKRNSAFSAWRASGTSDLIYGALYNSALAATVPGVTTRGNVGNEPATLQTAIAYSALGDGTSSEGAMVFGDTAIWSMFNDAGDLGKALTSASGSGFLNQQAPSGGTHTVLGISVPNTKTISQMLADMLVQYAGALALNQVSQSMVAPGSGASDVRQGVLAYGAATDGKSGVLSVDLSTNLWSDGRAGVSPIEGPEFRQAFFKDAAGTSFTDALKALGFKSAVDLAQKVWGAKDDSVIDRFDIAVGASGGTYSIAARAYPTDPWALTAQHVDIFVGTTGDDKVTGTSGGDILIGDGGKDHIDGGAGNDVIVATGGRDAVTVGGFGQDRILNTSAEGIIWVDVESGAMLGFGVGLGNSRAAAVCSDNIARHEAALYWVNERIAA